MKRIYEKCKDVRYAYNMNNYVKYSKYITSERNLCLNPMFTIQILIYISSPIITIHSRK